MTLAKICGLSTLAGMDAAIAGGASHVGLVFFPSSPRNVSLDQAVALGRRVPSHIKVVGVFVDPDDQLVDDAWTSGELDAIQLHGCAPERVAHFRRFASPIETWAAVPVRTSADLLFARALIGAADRVLYDARTPPGAALPGGMGLRFDWGLLEGFDHPLPWALSGGLDAGNVGEAIRRTGAPLVDVSSGVETQPGVKSMDKIAAFLKAVAA